MQEYHGDAKGRDESHEEQPQAVSTDRGRPPVCKLVAHHLPRSDPANKDAGCEGTEWQEDVGREEIAEVKEALSADRDVHGSAGERAGDADKDSDDRLDDSSFRPRDMQFLKEKRGADLVHGDGGGEGGKGEEGEENNTPMI